MANTPIELGPAGDRAAGNIKALRTRRGLELSHLSQKLTEIGRPIGVSALSRIENRSRRIDVADLAALALALQTTPNWLLFGTDPYHPLEPLSVTTAVQEPADKVWRWATGEYPLWPHTQRDVYDFQRATRPHTPPDNPAPLPRGLRDLDAVRRLEDAYKAAAELLDRDPRILDALILELKQEQQEPWDFDKWNPGQDLLTPLGDDDHA